MLLTVLTGAASVSKCSVLASYPRQRTQNRKVLGLATIEVTVCDVCRNPERRATQFHIAANSKAINVDLCDEHAAPLRDLLTHGSLAPAPRSSATRTPDTPARPRAMNERKAPARRKRASFDARVVTMDDIEARKGSK